MAYSEKPGLSPGERIQDGIRETERLIGQKQYNASMVRARQTLEYMVKYLCEKSGIMESGLIDMIDALYDERVISDTSCDHYHKIRTIGNKAIHEEDNNAYNANQAHHLLSQEVHTFASDYSGKKKRQAQTAPVEHSPERKRRTASGGGSNSRRRRARSSRPALELRSLLKPLLLVAIIVVLIFIIKMLNPDKKEPVETTEPSVTETVADSTEVTTTQETSTDAPAVVKYKVLEALNVRATPSKDGRKMGLLDPGTEVEFVSDVDEQWCIIKYMGNDAYVSKEFLQPIQ